MMINTAASPAKDELTLAQASAVLKGKNHLCKKTERICAPLIEEYADADNAPLRPAMLPIFAGIFKCEIVREGVTFSPLKEWHRAIEKFHDLAHDGEPAIRACRVARVGRIARIVMDAMEENAFWQSGPHAMALVALINAARDEGDITRAEKAICLYSQRRDITIELRCLLMDRCEVFRNKGAW